MNRAGDGNKTLSSLHTYEKTDGTAILPCLGRPRRRTDALFAVAPAIDAVHKTGVKAGADKTDYFQIQPGKEIGPIPPRPESHWA
jgi:hypothetical protein